MRQSDGGFKGVANDVTKDSVPVEAPRRFQFLRTLRVNKDDATKLLRLGPKRVKLGVG